ncbi:Uma2 family endonuclease [Hydrocoleum sp. CS-953]|nr:Uma2 family endonuclease [Hydrocoleum sp. CS-953]
MQVQTEKRYYTTEEYLALEETSEYKSEYHNGEITTNDWWHKQP